MTKSNKQTKKVRKSVPYETVLRNIDDCFRRANQWRRQKGDEYSVELSGWVYKYLAKAEALIELLEVLNCTQVGGFDYVGKLGQEDHPKYYGDLQKRYRWLKEVR